MFRVLTPLSGRENFIEFFSLRNLQTYQLLGTLREFELELPVFFFGILLMSEYNETATYFYKTLLVIFICIDVIYNRLNLRWLFYWLNSC
jgi:hypothetical protein